MPTDEEKNFGGLKNVLEALLFTAGKPFRAKELAKILELDEALVKSALTGLAEDRKESGVILLDNNGEYQLSTNSKFSTQVKNFLNAELREKLTDTTVEVLAIIAYRQPISKAEIEAIRGVNSQYSLRNLLMRGLIEKISNPSDARSFLYQTTTEFLMHLGLSANKELPEFEKLTASIKLPETAGLVQDTAANQPAQISEQIQNELPPVEPEKAEDVEEELDEDEEDDDEDESEEE